MSWRDNLLTASYKNVIFKVESAETSVGRRNAVHEYANRSNAYVQDFGRKVTSYSITGYIVQNKSNNYDYFKDRNRLMTAFQSWGPGTLVHPFLGVKRVSIQGQARFSENFQEGGIVKFTATFVEDGGRLPSFLNEGKEFVDNFSNVYEDKSADNFDKNLSSGGQFMAN